MSWPSVEQGTPRASIGGTVDDRNPASPHIHIDVLYYQHSYTFRISGLYKVMQDFYHQP